MNKILMNLIGSITIKIEGFDVGIAVNRLRKECKVISLYSEGEAYLATIPFFAWKKAREICSSCDCCLNAVSQKGVYFHLTKYRRRYGIVFGIIVSIVLAIYFSNVVFQIRIVGADNEEIISNVKEILEQEGLKPWAYIPNLNFLKLQSKLFEISDDVSWVSIGHSGSVVTVNLSVADKKAETDRGRIPCNIIATEDAQIVDINVLVGHLEILIGDAVAKGDLLVSGIVELKNGRSYYYHSIANITAQFERTVTFTQNIYDRTVSDGRTYYQKSIRIFDAEIPIPSVMDSEKTYITDSYTSMLYLFGMELPIGITTYEYTEQESSLIMYSFDEAESIVENKLEMYEENLLTEYEIVDREVELITHESSVEICCTYTLRGDIGVENPIYIK